MKKTNRKPLPPRLPVSVRSFIESVGQFIQFWGFMRLQGEIWALVFLSRRPLSAMEVAKLLGVSKASVSLALKELLDYQVIFLDSESGKRNLPLVANENLHDVIAGVLKLREWRMIQQTRSGLSALRAPQPSGLEIDEDRLNKVENLIEEAEGFLRTLTALPK